MPDIVRLPSLFDMHVHLRDPGYIYKEDIISGCSAARAGGFSGVACMPNTNPVADTPEILEYIVRKSKETRVEVFPVAAITKGMQGKELTDFKALKAAGAVAVSDDGRPVEDKKLMREAMERAFEIGLPVISHCEDLKIVNNGIINKGMISEKLGVEGIDRLSEDSVTLRECELAMETGTAIHIAHVSTRGSVDLIRRFKLMGAAVTCETCPHYFILTDEKLLLKDADYRMNPPLRTDDDRLAIIEALRDGTIDCIVTDHAPHSKEEKLDFYKAPNGVIGLEFSLAATLTALYHTKILTLERIVELMSINPQKILGIPPNGQTITVDLEEEWVVDINSLNSKAQNTCFKGMTFKGKVIDWSNEWKN